MERVFQIAAVVFVIIAVYFFWANSDKDYVFVAGVFAIAAGFLSYRFHLKTRIKDRDERQETLPE